MAWTPDLSGTRGPIYLALTDAIAGAIADGSLGAGEKLPSQRTLAGRLGIDLTTVTRAYAEAAQRGLIASEDRRGSFVRAITDATPPFSAEEEVSSGMNMPPEPAEGLLRAAIANGTSRLLENGGIALHYRPAGGTETDRVAGAAYLAAAISDTSPDQVVVAAGAQNALHAICGLLLGPRSRIAAGMFTYPGLLAVARRTGAEVVPIAMDGEGLLPDALDKAARNGRLEAVYVVPTNDNPTTATMGPERRAAIAAIATHHGIAIIEDDAYGRLAETPPTPIAALAPELTWHIAGLSKIVSPALRVAWLRAPNVRDAVTVSGDLHETAIMPSPLNVALASLWIADGTVPRLIAAVRHEGMERRKIATNLLGIEAQYQSEGYHLWLKLPAETDGLPGLPVMPGVSFAVDRRGPYPALRVALGGSRSRERLARDMRQLDAMLAGASRRDLALI